MVAAIVRLSHKYAMDNLRTAYLSRMQSCFSSDLERWSAAVRSHGSPVMKFRDVDAITAVNIARLTGTDSILPSALYLCCTLNPSVLITGVSRSNGSRERLSPQDTATCISGSQSLIQEDTFAMLNIWDPHRLVPQCPLESCQECIERSRIASPITTSVRNLVGAVRMATIRSLRDYDDLCRHCADALEDAEQGHRRELWAKLPHIFDEDRPSGWPEPDEYE